MAEPADSPESAEHPWQTANPWISGVLAYLLPGAGHLYQGRRFKGVLYMVCILGSFFYGSALADWKACTYDRHAVQRNWGFLAQLGVGLPAASAYWQSSRYEAQRERLGWNQNHRPRGGRVTELEGPISAPFEGFVFGDRVKGRIDLQPATDELGSPIVEGRLEATGEDGPVELDIDGRLTIQPELFADWRRQLEITTAGPDGQPGTIEGIVPRAFLDWYQIPLERDEEQALHKNLGRTFELALVYTWIAGLLNVLAVWDCVEGPAYGIGDEPEEEPGDPPKEGGATPDSESGTPQLAVAETGGET